MLADKLRHNELASFNHLHSQGQFSSSLQGLCRPVLGSTGQRVGIALQLSSELPLERKSAKRRAKKFRGRTLEQQAGDHLGDILTHLQGRN